MAFATSGCPGFLSESEPVETERLIGEYVTSVYLLARGGGFKGVPDDPDAMKRYRRFRSVETYLRGLTSEQLLNAFTSYKPTEAQIMDSSLYAELSRDWQSLQGDYESLKSKHSLLIDVLAEALSPVTGLVEILNEARK